MLYLLRLPINVYGQNKLLGLDWMCALFQTLEEKQNFDTLERDKLLPDLKRGVRSHTRGLQVKARRLPVSCLVVEEKLDALQPREKSSE